jgi:N-methylhydantoinase A
VVTDVGGGPRYRVGIDVGGTFTDLTLVSEPAGDVTIWKVPSTPADPSEAMLLGIAEALARVGAEPSAIAYLAHGTTVATNILLERRGARIALVTTQGFRDILEVARGRWPSSYDLDADKPKPLVSRALSYEVPERMLFDGTVHVPLDEHAVEELAAALVDEGVTSVAVSLLHGYANPTHERRIREILAQHAPHIAVSLSSDILPEYREYERTLTTAANAYLMPRMAQYLGALVHRVRDAGIPVEPLINGSSGGLLPVTTAVEKPVLTVMSGPSAGVVGALDVGRRAGVENLITFDMGGTSTDVALVDGGVLPVATSKDLGGLALAVPTADVVSIGAGGGSIARIDNGGLLKVGPESAGATPCPACYMRGGTLPTVTDAMMVLGYLNERYLLGGRMKVDRSAAEAVIRQHVADPLSISVEEAALGILDVTRSNIEQAILIVSVRRGFDPRDFSLLAYGGAGPQHAAALAANLAVSTVIIPYAPGTLCAQGLLASDMRTDYSKTARFAAAAGSGATLRAVSAELDDHAASWFESSEIPTGRQLLQRSVDMRYVGQHHQLSIPLNGTLEDDNWDDLNAAFNVQHHRLYGHSTVAPTEIVAVRLAAIGRVERLSGGEPASGSDAARPPEPVGSRVVSFARGQAPETASVYERADLRAGDVVEGPAIIEQMDTTTVILPRQRAIVDAGLNLILGPPLAEGAM